MLALSDEGLAHLAIAATRVPVAERGAWLQRIASAVDPGPCPPRPSPAASPRLRPGSLRTARQRERESRGAIVRQVEIIEADVAAAAIAAGELDEQSALSRDALRGVVEELVKKWCAEWGPA
jgi:hypothetical protein